MNRQYIGARYVPKFAEPYEWQSNVAYEPLTIVTYLNNSYTSKKPVPAGINPSNSEYWVMTGNYSGSIEQINAEIEKLKVDKKIGKYLPSVYRGDYFTNNSYPQSCCVNGDYIYCFNPTNWTRTGTVRKFSRSSNALVAQYNDVHMDHANGCCYWEGRGVCVAADYYNTGNGNVSVPAIYLYAPDFSTYTSIATNGTCQGVSYDHATHKMYYMNTNFEVYVYNETTSLFEYFGKINPNENGRFNQGIAINDDKYILVDMSGSYCSGDLHTGNMYPTVYGMTEFCDVEKRFFYTETEDMEYDEHGNLWGLRFNRYLSNALDCFVVNYVSDVSGVISFDPWVARYDFPWLIDSESVAQFRLGWRKLRNVQQTQGLVFNPYKAVRIMGVTLVEDYQVVLSDDLVIDIRDGAEWKPSSLQMRFGSFSFYQNDTRSKLTVGTLPINAADAKEISFVGSGRLITNNDDANTNIYVAVGTGAVLGRVRYVPKNANGVAIKWGDIQPVDGCLLVGGTIAVDF